MEGKKRKVNIFIKILFIINNIPLLPCAYVTLWGIAARYIAVHWIWTRAFLGFLLPIVFLRCYDIPYISSGIIIFVYLICLIKNKFPKRDTIEFVVLLVICILGLVSVETVFRAVMGI